MDSFIAEARREAAAKKAIREALAPFSIARRASILAEFLLDYDDGKLEEPTIPTATSAIEAKAERRAKVVLAAPASIVVPEALRRRRRTNPLEGEISMERLEAWAREAGGEIACSEIADRAYGKGAATPSQLSTIRAAMTRFVKKGLGVRCGKGRIALAGAGDPSRPTEASANPPGLPEKKLEAIRKLSTSGQRILAVLELAGRPMAMVDVAKALVPDRQSNLMHRISALMPAMARKGRLARVGYGLYALPTP